MENQTKFQTRMLPLLIILALVVLAIGFFIKAPTKISQNTGTANLSWSANTESDLAGYKIYYGTSPRTANCPPAGYPNKIDVGKTDTPDKPTYTIKNLENSKTYYFSITSYDSSNNESCFSEETNKAIK